MESVESNKDDLLHRLRKSKTIKVKTQLSFNEDLSRRIPEEKLREKDEVN